ncbi:MAG: hypothetical protein Q8Q05_02005 [bacterium]|nr:hypothetical protein [bacterium]
MNGLIFKEVHMNPDETSAVPAAVEGEEATPVVDGAETPEVKESDDETAEKPVAEEGETPEAPAL